MKKRVYTDAIIKYTNDRNKENYDRLAVNVCKGSRERLKAIAIEKGYRSLNAYIVELLERDTNLKLMGVE